ncbi:DUF6471 domain-containing protein [Hypericibacter sp.]|uniref:DUF6471 domain-containing protein n=1 Tax=Hypericibacter sp. TaxID=2705401 RepID=UPI003D6C82C6
MTKDIKEIDWGARTKGILKAELKRRNVSYRKLAEKLEPLGVKETERNIANKIARGSFTAMFLLQCLEAIGARKLRLDD